MISRTLAVFAYVALLLHYVFWGPFHGPRPSVDSSVVWFALWFAVPMTIIWNSKRLSGKIRFGAISGEPETPAWAVAALGWIMLMVQTAGYFLLQIDWAWLYAG